MNNVNIVLIGTSHPGNIGAVARAMKNMGLSRLSLVDPLRFPDEDADARASGATDILDAARVCDSLDDALVDSVYVCGASARARRTIAWPTLNPRECAQTLLSNAADGPVTVLFGPEKSGLTNKHLDRCQSLLSIPTAPDFSSLNLAMAVQVLCYELRMASMAVDTAAQVREVPLATAGDMELFYTHLEQVMIASRFMDPDNPRHLMRRLRRLFARAEPDQNELNILRGILAAVEPGK